MAAAREAGALMVVVENMVKARGARGTKATETAAAVGAVGAAEMVMAAAVMGRVTLGKVVPAMAVGVEEEDVEVVPQVGAAAVAVEMATRTARVVVSKGG